MMQTFLADLVRQSVIAPRHAARQVIGLGLSVQALLMIFALTIVANTLVFYLSLGLAPPAAGVPALFANPLVYAAIVGTGALGYVLLLTRIGVALGGAGTITEILAITVWLQCLRVLAQVAILVVMILSGALAAILTFGVSLFGLWLFITFLQEAHRFEGPMRALVTAGLAVLALSFAAALLLTMTGVSPPQQI